MNSFNKLQLKNLESFKNCLSNNNYDLKDSRFALGNNNNWFLLLNTFNEVDNYYTIQMLTLSNNTIVEAGKISYKTGKGFYFNRQVIFNDLRVSEDFRKNGLATYGLSFLTEIAKNQRIDFIDGKYYPSEYGVEKVYNKNGFTVEKEDYDTRIVKTIENEQIEAIQRNTFDIFGLKVYNNYKNLYVSKYRNANLDLELSH